MMNNDLDDSALAYLSRRILTGNRFSSLLSAYTAFGLLFALVSFGYIAYGRLNIRLSANEQLALAAGFSGLAFSAFSYVALNFRKALLERQKEQYDQYAAITKFIEAWSVFEATSRKNAFGDTAEQSNSIRDTLSELRKLGKLTPTDVFEAEELLRVRNSLVHGSGNVATHTIRNALDKLVDLITRL